MVIASLVVSIAINGEELLNVKINEIAEEEDAAGGAEQERDDMYLLRGEWRSILMLVANLEHGRLAKRITDKVRRSSGTDESLSDAELFLDLPQAINRMEAVQNLRTCVYDAKLRLNVAEEG